PGPLLVRRVLEVAATPVARAAADGAHKARDRTGLGILDLTQHGRDVERAVDQPERATADRRDQSHLVSIGKLMAALDVLTVHRVQEASRFRPEVQRGPDVL